MFPNTNNQHPNPYANGLPNVLPAGGSIVGTHLPTARPASAAGGPSTHDYHTQRMLRQLTGGSHATTLHNNTPQGRALDAAMNASGIHGHQAVELRRTLQAMGRGESFGGAAATGMPSHMPTSVPHQIARPINISMPHPHF